jgi:hypothetical protein
MIKNLPKWQHASRCADYIINNKQIEIFAWNNSTNLSNFKEQNP